MPSVINLSDDQLIKIVHNGTQGGMPAFPRLSDADVVAVVGYLRTLQGQKPVSGKQVGSGNIDSGRTLFSGQAQCSSCHRVGGMGAFTAADLTTYGRNHTQDAIAKAIVAPDGLASGASPIVEVRSKSGQKITGAVRWEDNFNIELQSQDGRYYFLKRDALAGIALENKSRAVHSFQGTLTEMQIKDIAYYLMTTAMQAPAEGPMRRHKSSMD